MAKKPTLSPAEKAQKEMLKNLSPNERKTFMEIIEKRLKSQKPPRERVRDRAKKAFRSQAKAGQEAAKTTAKTTAKTATEATKKVAKKVAARTGRAAGQVGEAAVKGAGKVGKGLGALSAGAKAIGKVAAPIAAISEAANVAKIVTTDEGKQEAKDYATNMAEDNAIVRAAKGAWRPSDTIAGAAMNLADAAKLGIAENMRGAELDRTADARLQATRDRMAALKADRAAKMKVSDEPAVPVEEVEEEMGEPAIRKRDARFLDRLDERILEDLRTEPVEAEPVEAAAAEPEMDYTDEAVGLFKNTHGTEFDPNSKMDREKLDKMKGILAKQGGLGNMSPNQFALQVYRNS